MWLWIMLGVVVGLVGLAYLLLPLLIKAQMVFRLDRGPVDVDPATLAAEDAMHFGRVGQSLATRGYAPVGVYRLEEMVPRTRMTFALFRHPTAHTEAMATAMRSDPPEGAEPQPPKYGVELSSELRDGREINTNNLTDSVSADQNPEKSTWVFPEESDAAALLELHDAICAELAGGTSFEKARADQPVDAWLVAQLRKEMDRKVERGYWTAEQGPTETVYRMTLKGAYVNTWGELPPFKGWRRTRMLRRAEKMRERLGFRRGL